MKKLFGHKQKSGKPNSTSRDYNEDIPKPTIPTPVYQKLATHGNHPVGQSPPQQPLLQQPPQSAGIDGDGWEVLATQPSPDPSQLANNPYSVPLVVPPSRTSSFTQLPNGTPQPLQNQSAAQPQPPSSTPINQPPLIHQTLPTGPPKGKLVRHHDPARDAYVQSQANMRSKPASERQYPSSLHPSQPPQSTAPVAMSILRALEPPKAALVQDHMRSQSDYGGSESGHTYRDREEKKERRGFWGGGKDKDKDKDRDRDRPKERPRERPPQDRIQYEQDHRISDYRREEDNNPQELMRMIGYLTATASEDWELVMKVCERASASESNAKEAVRALRREFKYGEPPAQLSAARLWAIMLRNSTDVFILQSTSRKFLDTVEELLLSPKTAPVVRERLLDVVGAAAYASGTKKDSRHDKEGFKGLWKRVKPFDKPDEGVPIDTDDAMFNPPASGRLSAYETPMAMGNFQDNNPYPMDSAPPTPTPNVIKKRKSPSNRIIPPDEDMRRLFQECKIGQGNASVLSESLGAVKPEELRKNSVIKEFYMKCRSSQELIYAQIPWATANADRSRRERELAPKDAPPTKRTDDLDQLIQNIMDFPMELTIEEKLLAALLSVNGDLLEALKQYDDVLRVAQERKAEDRSRRERAQKIPIRDETNMQNHQAHYSAPSFVSQASSRTPSPTSRASSPALSYNHPSHHHLGNEPETPIASIQNGAVAAAQQNLNAAANQMANPNANLMPPPPAPHGPRSPAAGLAVAGSLGSITGARTPSPGTPKVDGQGHAHSHSASGASLAVNGSLNGTSSGYPRISTDDDDDIYSVKAPADEEDVNEYPIQPSDKALGKRKVVDTDVLPSSPLNAESPNSPYDSRRDSVRSFDPEYDDENDTRWRPRPQITFVYDAVAERRRQHLEEIHDLKANAVH